VSELQLPVIERTLCAEGSRLARYQIDLGCGEVEGAVKVRLCEGRGACELLDVLAKVCLKGTTRPSLLRFVVLGSTREVLKDALVV
jgi:hypothetical protein